MKLKEINQANQVELKPKMDHEVRRALILASSK